MDTFFSNFFRKYRSIDFYWENKVNFINLFISSEYVSSGLVFKMNLVIVKLLDRVGRYGVVCLEVCREECFLVLYFRVYFKIGGENCICLFVLFRFKRYKIWLNRYLLNFN